MCVERYSIKYLKSLIKLNASNYHTTDKHVLIYDKQSFAVAPQLSNCKVIFPALCSVVVQSEAIEDISGVVFHLSNPEYDWTMRRYSLNFATH